MFEVGCFLSLSLPPLSPPLLNSFTPRLTVRDLWCKLLDGRVPLDRRSSEAETGLLSSPRPSSDFLVILFDRKCGPCKQSEESVQHAPETLWGL